MGRPNRISNQTTKTFSERLSDLVEAEKKDTGKRQKEIAAAIGVSSGTLSEWCSDQKTPTIDALPKLSAYFNVSADWLLGLSDVKSPDSSVQGIQRMTGLSEIAIDRLSDLNELADDLDELITPYHHGSIRFINRIIEKSTPSIVGALYFDYQRAKCNFEDKEVLYAEKKEEYEKHFLGKEDFFDELSGKVRNAELKLVLEIARLLQ